MIKMAERFFEWAVKRACIMMCEVATKRDEKLAPARTQTRRRV